MIYTKQCPSCEAKNVKGAAFCSKCGAELAVSNEIQKKPCPDCGFKNTADSNFCIRCGANLAIWKPEKSNSDAYSGNDSSVQDSYLYRIIRSGILTFIALLITVFAFLPITNGLTDSYGIYGEYDFSAIDHISFFIAACENDPNEYLDDMNEYRKNYNEDLDEISEKYDKKDDAFKNAYEKLSQKYASKYAKIRICMEKASANYEMTSGDVIHFVAAFVYLIIALLLFTLALSNLISVIKGNEGFFRASVLLMCLLGSVIPAMSFAMGGKHIAVFGILSMIFAFIGVALVIGEKFFFDREYVDVKSIVTKAVCAAITVIMMILSTSPIIAFEIDDATYAKSSNTASTDKGDLSIYFDGMELNEIFDLTNDSGNYPKVPQSNVEKFYLGNVDSSAQGAFRYVTEEKIESGESDSLVFATVRKIVVSVSGTNSATVYAAVYVIALCACMIAGFLLTAMLMSIAFEEKTSSHLLLKFLNVVFVLIGLIIGVVIVTAANKTLSLVDSDSLAFRISACAVIHFILSVAYVFVSKKSKYSI